MRQRTDKVAYFYFAEAKGCCWQAIFFFLDTEMCAGGIRTQVKLKMCSGRLSPSESHDHVCWRETELQGLQKMCAGRIGFPE
jgi:hypothetical protein